MQNEFLFLQYAAIRNSAIIIDCLEEPHTVTYVTLMKFTDHGIRNVKETTKRAEAFKEAAKKAGVTVKEIYWTLGQYDLVATVEGPDDQALTTVGLALGAAGNPSY